MTRGDLVQHFWSDGRSNAGWVYGIVEKCGHKTMTVRWESGVRNRIRRGSGTIELIRDAEIRAEVRAKLEASREAGMKTHIRIGDPERRLPVDTDEQRAIAKRALADAGVLNASVWHANGYHTGDTIWADEATWRGWTIIRDGERRFIERNGARREVRDAILGDIRCEIDRIWEAEQEASDAP